MDALKIAGARSLTADNPEAFLLAFNAGLHAAELDVDSARFLRSLLVDGHASSAAGFLAEPCHADVLLEIANRPTGGAS
ncbi:hypothetical protein ACIO6U_03040 [Streptomyces sp. NPDC087422]|uniref:hypothetical protein n=1 Tax=Streptomyces sp. NPDC087422 TaxID=3365786 RepID=UPI00380AAE08